MINYSNNYLSLSVFVIFVFALSGCIENTGNLNKTGEIGKENFSKEISTDSLLDMCVKRAYDIRHYEFEEMVKISISGTMNMQISINQNGIVNLKEKRFFVASDFNIMNTVLQAEMYKIDAQIYYAEVKDNKREWKIYTKEDVENKLGFIKYADLFNPDDDYGKKFTSLKNTEKEIVGSELIDGQNCGIVKIYVNTIEVLKEKNLSANEGNSIENLELKLWISKSNGDVMKEYKLMTLKGNNNAITTIEKTTLYKNYNKEVVINPPI
ncbi:MAG: hypothetical protein BWK75_05145 [Candidatus Altiarchaeales archaeon A3]|nr:MAG: hypothetical protein BWK75_05145 [Candidatus Altiarchaeales archaeon A3]